MIPHGQELRFLLGVGSDLGATFQIGPRNTDTIQISISAIEPLSTIGNGGLNLHSHISLQANAMGYIVNIDKAISIISAERAKYGATMNRLDHAVWRICRISRRTYAVSKRIMDADYAAESSNLARTQVLQQASMAMLAQANASKQNILALFQ